MQKFTQEKKILTHLPFHALTLVINPKLNSKQLFLKMY